MPYRRITPRTALGSLSALAGGVCLTRDVLAGNEAPFRLSTFAADVTPPLGHSLVAGASAPSLAQKSRV